MKHFNKIMSLIILAVALTFISCTNDFEYDNVYDPDFFETVSPFLKLQVVSENEVKLNWEYELEINTGFKLEAKNHNNNWQLITNELAPATREWIITDNSSEYIYRLTALVDEYESYPSNAVFYNEFALVEAGEFSFGENATIETIGYDYEIMVKEVTNLQFGCFLQDGIRKGFLNLKNGNVYGSYDGVYFPGSEYVYYNIIKNSNRIQWDGIEFQIEEEYANHPVTTVSWFGAKAFAEYYGWQIPTEKEWEKAARGNTGFDYPWGNDIDGSRANFKDSDDPWENSAISTTPAGFYNGETYNEFQTLNSPSIYFCYDMSGNVIEWTNSLSTNNSDYVVLKGGSWKTAGNFESLKIWHSSSYYPDENRSDYGFRCLKRNGRF